MRCVPLPLTEVLAVGWNCSAPTVADRKGGLAAGQVEPALEPAAPLDQLEHRLPLVGPRLQGALEGQVADPVQSQTCRRLLLRIARVVGEEVGNQGGFSFRPHLLRRHIERRHQVLIPQPGPVGRVVLGLEHVVTALVDRLPARPAPSPRAVRAIPTCPAGSRCRRPARAWPAVSPAACGRSARWASARPSSGSTGRRGRCGSFRSAAPPGA